MSSSQLEYAILAQLHRPVSPEAIRNEVIRLFRTGLKPVDISAALQLDLAQVRGWLGVLH